MKLIMALKRHIVSLQKNISALKKRCKHGTNVPHRQKLITLQSIPNFPPPAKSIEFQYVLLVLK